jgi:hypothetical protein
VKRKHKKTEKKRCKICGDKLKGHLCRGNKIDEKKIKEILLFLNNFE